MVELVCDGDVMTLEPAIGWKWHAWNGEITIGPGANKNKKLKILGNGAIFETDLVALESKLVGKPYVADGFSDLPGATTKATIRVDTSSLTSTTTVAGKRAATTRTIGSFAVVCRPSCKPGFLPGTWVPDPGAAVRTGQWRISKKGKVRMKARD